MKRFNFLYKLLFQVFIFFLPTQLAYHFWPEWALIQGIRVDYLAPAVYLTDILIVALCIMYYVRNPLPKISRWVLLFIFINIVISLRWQIALIKWIKIGELFLLVYVVARDVRINVRSWVIKPLTLSVVFFTLLAFIQIFLGHTVGGLFYWLGERTFNTQTPGISLLNIFDHTYLKAYSTFSHPNSLAGFLGVALLLFTMYETRWTPKIFSTLGIALTFSLGAVIGLALRKLPRYFFYILILLSLLLPLISSQLLNIQFPDNIADRLTLYVASGQMISKHILFGVGLNNFIVGLTQITVNSGRVWLLQPVHNIISLIVSEMGVVGLALFIFGVTRIYTKMNKKYLSIIMFIFITGMFDHYWLTLQQNLLLMSVVLGLSFRSTKM